MPPRWLSRRRDSNSKSEKDQASSPNILKSLFRWRKKRQNPEISQDGAEGLNEPTKDEELVTPVASSPVEEEERPSLQEFVFDENVLRSLFSGAPQFSITGTDGQDIAGVGFPYDYELVMRDASDCTPIIHQAYSASTAQSHLVPGGDIARHAPEYDVGIVEKPAMLVSQGKELGTVGFRYFLEDAISDVLYQKDEAAQDNAMNALQNEDLINSDPEKLGLRKFDLKAYGERLVDLRAAYKEYQTTNGKIHLLKRYSTEELYNSLFDQFILPPKGANKAGTGLKTQIETILRILNLKSLWFDFSSVDWRIRVGQLLWTDVQQAALNNPSLITPKDNVTDRDILIMQITLSCELLLRLDALAAVDVQAIEGDIKLSAQEIADFRALETRKTKWDLLLARSFLRNIQVKISTRDIAVPAPKPALSAIPFLTIGLRSETTSSLRKTVPDVSFQPVNIEQQITGLFKFANTINWPEVDGVEEQLRSKLTASSEELPNLPAPSLYSTPLSSPRSMLSQRSSYFDTRPELDRRRTPLSLNLQSSNPALRESANADKEPNANMIGGWLTRTYITGFVLPGEGISHFLISSLLENDPQAIAKLGDSASLYGGFAYDKRSWWSKGCIVGRVMAALPGASECMGWIYVPETPTDINNTWFDIQYRMPRTIKPPRIKQGEAVGTSSEFSAGIPVESVHPTDFMIPADPEELPSPLIHFKGLHLKVFDMELKDALQSESSVSGLKEQSLPPQVASLHFESDTITNSSPIQIPLTCLVSFISAFPCFPPPLDIPIPSHLTGPTKPTHLLHKSQTYKILPAHQLLTNPPFDDNDDDYDGIDDNKGTVDEMNLENREVLIIDARGDAGLSLFARAWCAWKGEHALVARVGVSCLSCCVREARALGIKVVIRVQDIHA